VIIRRDIGGAAWPDLVGDVFIYAVPTSIMAARIGRAGSDVWLMTLWQQPTPEPLMFVRAAAGANGAIVAVGKGNRTGAAYVVRADRCEQLAPVTNGNNPIAVLSVGAGVLIRWIEPGGIIATRWPDGSTQRDPIPPPWTGTATGILDLAGDGSALYMDAARTRQIGEWIFTKPIARAGVVVGQGDGPPAIRVAVGNEVFTALEAPDASAEDPHLSVLENGRIFVSAFTSRGASVALIDPPYPPAEHPTAPPAPPAPPPPKPPPPPAPPHPPPPRPPAPPRSLFQSVRHLQGVPMKGFVKIHTNAPHYTGVVPSPAGGKSGDAAFPVYFDREGEPDTGGAWETVEFSPHDDGTFDARYVEADRQLSIQPDGRLETRAAGAIGGYERFQIRTEDGSSRHILYRDDLVGPVLEVEVQS